MAVRVIDYVVSLDGIEPSTIQQAGTQGDHKVTAVKFNADAFESVLPDDVYWRIEGRTATGIKKSTVPELVSQEGSWIFEYPLENWLTREGGMVTVRLVLSAKGDNDETVLDLYTFVAKLALSANEGYLADKEYKGMVTLLEQTKKYKDDAAISESNAFDYKQGAEEAATNAADILGKNTDVIGANTVYGQVKQAKDYADAAGETASQVVANQIIRIDQTQESTEDNGKNVWTATFGDGRTENFVVENGSKGDKGDKGDAGNGISKTLIVENPPIGYGSKNTITFIMTDGSESKHNTYNGRNGADGIGISKTIYAHSLDDGGENILTMSFTDGSEREFKIKNGSKGSKGDKGDKGDTPENVILYTGQSLTQSQKEQARENIGAASASYFNEVQSINLFDKTQPRESGLAYFTGTPVSNAKCENAAMPVKIGKSYTYPIRYSWYGSTSAYSAPCYDVDGNYIGYIKGTPNTDNTLLTVTIDESNIQVPGNAVNPSQEPIAFIGVSVSTNSAIDTPAVYVDNFMFVEGTNYPSEYVPYGEMTTLAKNIKLTNENILSVDPLYGKKLSVNGDSICAGAGSTGGYAAIIGEMYNMQVQNIGVNGGTITAESYKENGSARHWISRTIANMDADADYAIVEGGVNDSSLSLPLGAITADYGDTLNDATFYGAFESMLKQLLIRFAGKKVGYIAVHQMSLNYRANNDKETSYYWAAKACCEKWGVPFLDLNTTVPPFGLVRNTTAQADLYSALREQYTYNADGWHPNEEGYKKYYVPKIVAWMKTL